MRIAGPGSFERAGPIILDNHRDWTGTTAGTDPDAQRPGQVIRIKPRLKAGHQPDNFCPRPLYCFCDNSPRFPLPRSCIAHRTSQARAGRKWPQGSVINSLRSVPLIAPFSCSLRLRSERIRAVCLRPWQAHPRSPRHPRGSEADGRRARAGCRRCEPASTISTS